MDTLKNIGIATVILGTIAVGGVAVSQDTPIEIIEKAQNEAFVREGKYVQVIKSNKLPDGIPAKEKLGKDIPDGYVVDEYEAPTGKGYVIRWEDEIGWHSKGYGVESVTRTWDILKNPKSATST